MEAFQRVPPGSPDYLRAQVQLGATFEDSGNVKEAEKVYLGVLAMDPGNDAARRNLESIGVAKAVKAPVPGPNPGKDSVLSSGIRALEANDFERAIRVFRLARGLFPNDPRPLFYSALTMERKGLLAEARAIYESVLRMDQSYLPARVNLVILLLEKGDRQGARRALYSGAVSPEKDPRVKCLTRILGGPGGGPVAAHTASVSTQDKVAP